MSKLAMLHADIGTLSSLERRELLTLLAFEEAQDSPVLTRSERFAFDASLAFCDGVQPPLATFLTHFGARKFAMRVKELHEFIAETRRFLRQPQMDALIKLCLRCLAQDLRQRSI